VEKAAHDAMAEYVAFSHKVSREEPNQALIEDFKKQDRWGKPTPMHVSMVVSSFSTAVMAADNWEGDYLLPRHFEGVLNWLSFMLKKKNGGSCVLQDTVEHVSDLALSLASDHPDFSKWKRRMKTSALRCNLIECLWYATETD